MGKIEEMLADVQRKVNSLCEENGKTRQEKVEEAEFLGAAMAHSYTRELRNIAEELERQKEESSPKKEVHEGVAIELRGEANGITTSPQWDWVIEVSPNTFLALGAIAEVERWKGKKIRITVEEIL
jgi:hypothetical protein